MTDSTRRTLRTAFAALVALAAMAPVLVTQAGLDPGRWPWLAGVLAVAAVVTRVMAVPAVDAWLTTLGLGKAPSDGRHELGREEVTSDAGGSDAGRARLPLILVLLAALTVFTAGPATARRPAEPRPAGEPSPRLEVVPTVTSTAVCGGVLVVTFNALLREASEEWPLMDNGYARLEVWDLSGRSWPNGMWIPVSGLKSGGEHALRWPGWLWAGAHGLHLHKVRVLVGVTRSEPVAIRDECVS